MKVLTITCDHCGADLSVVDSGFDEYRIALSVEKVRNTSNTRYATDFPPPLSREHHFCNMNCLKQKFYT